MDIARHARQARFEIREFIENAKVQAVKDRVANLRKALLFMHAATDQIVGIEYATAHLHHVRRGSTARS